MLCTNVRRPPHTVLGVAPNATPEEVNNAFRNLAFRFHPDVNAEADDAEFKELANARDLLLAGGVSMQEEERAKKRSRQQTKSPPKPSATETKAEQRKRLQQEEDSRRAGERQRQERVRTKAAAFRERQRQAQEAERRERQRQRRTGAAHPEQQQTNNKQRQQMERQRQEVRDYEQWSKRLDDDLEWFREAAREGSVESLVAFDEKLRALRAELTTPSPIKAQLVTQIITNATLHRGALLKKLEKRTAILSALLESGKRKRLLKMGGLVAVSLFWKVNPIRAWGIVEEVQDQLRAERDAIDAALKAPHDNVDAVSDS